MSEFSLGLYLWIKGSVKCSNFKTLRKVMHSELAILNTFCSLFFNKTLTEWTSFTK